MATPHDLKRFLGKWRVYASTCGHFVAFTQPFQNQWQDAGTILIAYGVNPSLGQPSLVVLQLQATRQYLVPYPAALNPSVGPTIPGHQLQAIEPDFDLAYEYLFQSATLGGAVSDADRSLRFTTFNWGVCLDAFQQPALGFTERTGQLLDFDVRVVTPSPLAIRASGSCSNGDFSYVDFNGEDLSGLVIPNANLAGALLAGCKFVKTDLSGTDFAGVNLAKVDLAGAVLDGCDFTGVDLSVTTLSGGPVPTSMRNARFASNSQNSMLDGVKFENVDLTGADFTGASLVRTDFRGATLKGITFSGCDLTQAMFDDQPLFSHDQQQPMKFVAATVPYELLGQDWRWFDLTGATVVGLPQTLSTSASKLLAAGARLSGLNGNNLAGRTVENADFSNAVLDGVNFHRAHLSGTSFVQARMHGTVLTGATMRGADLTSAQLGSQGLLFSVPSTSGDYQPFLDALNNGDTIRLAGILTKNGIEVTQVKIETPSPSHKGSVWVVTDDRSGAAYTVRLLSRGSQTMLSVLDNQAEHAALGDAYLPGAILTSANLYGVTASGIHLYGAGTRLDNAILEAVDFSKANLGNASLAQAALYDAIFDDAVLTNVDFQGAYLERGQTNRGVSMQRANLQGADFRGAKLYGANLQDAAVCVPLESDPQSSYGVWLDQVQPDDSLYVTYLTELNRATELVTLDARYEANLAPGPADDGLRAAFADRGVALGPGATVTVVEQELTWQIVDGATNYVFVPGYDDNATAAYLVLPSTTRVAPFSVPWADGPYLRSGPVAPQLRQDLQANGRVSLSSSAQVSAFDRPVIWQLGRGTSWYDVWEGFDTAEDTLERQLVVRPSIPTLTVLFRTAGTVLKRATISGSRGLWSVDNDSANASNTALGYVVFNVVQAGSNGPLDLYGSRMRIERLGDGNQLEYSDIVSQPTVFSAANFDANVIYPNGNKETIVGGHVQAAWMRTPRPPSPPTCVPSGYYYCPPSGASSKRA